MNITAILKKLAAGETINAAEKALLLANKDVLSAEQLAATEKAETVEETEEEEVDEKALETLISTKIAARIESITNQLAEKFLEGVSASRAKAIETGHSQARKGDEKVRGFMKALFTNDHATLKDISGLSDGVGGYLLPVELRSEILRVARTRSSRHALPAVLRSR